MLIGRDAKADNEEESEEHNHARLEIDSNAMIQDILNISGKNEEEKATSKSSEVMRREACISCRENDIGNTSINAGEKTIGRKEERTTYECSACGAHFTRQGEFKRHMVKHSDVRPYKCTVCERAFKRSSEVMSHMQIHNGVTYACETCGFTTTNKVSLRTHIRRVHRRDFRYRCEQCGKGFMSNYDLEDHKASHLDAKTFVCEYCGNAYSQKSYLVAHKRVIHRIRKTAPKQHRCELCSKSFASEYSLRNHASLHSQRFLCAQCGKEFATNHALKLHTRMHTGERPYQCKLCAKAFARSAALRVHKLTHTGERPYVCDLCGQSFTQRSSMMVHRRKHPGSHPPPPPLLLSRLDFDTQKSN